MSRTYDGDIEGKFWFGLQSSNAANRFGYIGHPPEYLEYHFDTDDLENVEYHFDTDDLENVESLIKNIEEKLKDKLSILDEFYDVMSVDKPELEAIVKQIDDESIANYADLVLGRKIRDCIKTNGCCDFTAEL